MKISIITACYCSAGSVAQTIRSVLGQSWGDIEYIVVDGNSTDGTMEIVREYEPKFQGRMRWVSEPDVGMYDALNKGLRMATGDVVGVLHADDAFQDDGVVQRVVGAFDDGTDAVYSDIRFADCAGRTIRYYSARHWRPWMLQWGYMPPHPGVYIRRECFGRLGDYKQGYHIAADYELIIRFLRKSRLRARYLPVCAVEMRMGGKSTRGWKSNLVLNQEIVRGNRENGYLCCLPMLVPKYLFKVFEFIIPKARRVLGTGKGERS
ncbi:MAG: glycosyltransferase [Kiritimatiellaeota bacterium]|nr:glycosyltransferase [Kiritimatiellota bacterium]